MGRFAFSTYTVYILFKLLARKNYYCFYRFLNKERKKNKSLDRQRLYKAERRGGNMEKGKIHFDSGIQWGMSEEMLSELSLERWPEIRTEE